MASHFCARVGPSYARSDADALMATPARESAEELDRLSLI